MCASEDVLGRRSEYACLQHVSTPAFASGAEGTLVVKISL